MSKKKVILNFPPQLIDQPITSILVKDFDLVVNILKARITPREWGTMVVELDDREGKLEAALAFLTDQGVGMEPLAKELAWHEERCIHCTACTGPCPTHALAVSDRSLMTVAFDRELCIACGLCLPVCPYHALEIMF